MDSHESLADGLRSLLQSEPEYVEKAEAACLAMEKILNATQARWAGPRVDVAIKALVGYESFKVPYIGQWISFFQLAIAARVLYYCATSSVSRRSE